MKRVITSQGRGNYTIVTSQFADEGVLYAAMQLKEYLYKSTNAVVTYFSDRCPKRDPEIIIGNGARNKDIDLSDLVEDGFLITTDGEDIIITGKNPRGVIYGVYKFLELFINLKCFTKDAETFDKKDEIIVEDIDICENPDFEYRDVLFRGMYDGDFAVKSRLNSSVAYIPYEKGGKYKFYNFHHSFSDILPPSVYFKDHPEWYSLAGDARIADGQLCLTNEDAIQEAIKNVRKWIQSRPDCKVFSVAQNDNVKYCTCEKCKSVCEEEGAQSGAIIRFVNRIAEVLGKEYPHLLFHTFAYQYSRKAPKYAKPLDNVIVRLCNIECSWHDSIENQAQRDSEGTAADFYRNIKDWSKICRHLYIWDYACNYRHYLLPFPNYNSLQENLKMYKENNVAGVLEQGNFSLGNASGMADFQVYMGSKLLWDVNADFDKIAEDFTSGYYGSAGKYMKDYIYLLKDSSKDCPFSLYYEPNVAFITDEFMEKAEKIFQGAFGSCDDERVLQRIKKEYLAIKYLKICRMSEDAPRRNALIDELYEEVKGCGITEIRERGEFDGSFDVLKRVEKPKFNGWCYYINR